MRWVVVAAWLVGSALFGASQTSAHEARQSPPPAAETPSSSAAATVAPSHLADLRLCTSAPTSVVATLEAPAHDHANDHDADHEHDPTDHRHPPGDDAFHQMTAHGCPDFAAHSEFTPKHAHSSIAHAFPLRHEVAEGISLVPPVPPPLG